MNLKLFGVGSNVTKHSEKRYLKILSKSENSLERNLMLFNTIKNNELRGLLKEH